MGNKLCKRKGDTTLDNTTEPSASNGTSSFNRIISKFNLKPRWKSDSQINKQRTELSRNPQSATMTTPRKTTTTTDSNEKQLTLTTRPLSKSSDWTEVPLQVPDTPQENHDRVDYVKNPKLSLIFNDNHTPTPPPRKHKKSTTTGGGIREKIKAVAKSSLQAVSNNSYAGRKPVEEPLCVKKVIDYSCPNCNKFGGSCNKHNINKESLQKLKIQDKNRTNSTSTSSLPIYQELKLSIPKSSISQQNRHNSASVHSLPDNNKTIINDNEEHLMSVMDKDDKDSNYMARCRSFGSLLPQLLLHKLSAVKAPLAEIESDDSFGGLEDWDVGLIEHYNPKDASLPRPKGGGQRRDEDILADIEGMLVQEESTNKSAPSPPQRKTETLLKKITRENEQQGAALRPPPLKPRLNINTNNEEINTTRSTSVTPPPSPSDKNNLHNNNNPFETMTTTIIETTTTMPAVSTNNDLSVAVVGSNIGSYDNKEVEHSSLMRILEEFTVKDTTQQLKQQDNLSNVGINNRSNESNEDLFKIHGNNNTVTTTKLCDVVEDVVAMTKRNNNQGVVVKSTNPFYEDLDSDANNTNNANNVNHVNNANSGNNDKEINLDGNIKDSNKNISFSEKNVSFPNKNANRNVSVSKNAIVSSNSNVRNNINDFLNAERRFVNTDA